MKKSFIDMLLPPLYFFVLLMVLLMPAKAYSFPTWIDDQDSGKNLIGLYVGDVLILRMPKSYMNSMKTLANKIDESFKRGFLLRDLDIAKNPQGLWCIKKSSDEWIVANQEISKFNKTEGRFLAAGWLNNFYKAFALLEAKRNLSRGNSGTMRSIEGYGSWYGGDDWNGKETASGEIYDDMQLVTANKEYPFNSILKVTNTWNSRSVYVRVCDRGPFVKGRIVDLSRSASRIINMGGIAPVVVEMVSASDRVGGWR